jgi:hypothetical protein
MDHHSHVNVIKNITGYTVLDDDNVSEIKFLLH